MRRLYQNRVGDVGLSRNGWAAYQRGEQPHDWFVNGEEIVPTEPHHIEVPYRIRGDQVQRKLVMFYRVRQ